jgi:hypothetical protein
VPIFREGILAVFAGGSGPPADARIVALMDEFGWAERAAVPRQRIAVLSHTVSFSAAAALPLAGLTALCTLRHTAHRCLDRRVLITGTAGRGRSSRGELAAPYGARVIAVAAGTRGGAADANGAVLAFGKSSGEMASISFADFRGRQNALAELLLIPSGPKEQIAPDLALLMSLVADKSLTPQTGPERKARHCAVADELRDRFPICPQGIYKSQFCCGSTRRRPFAASTVKFSKVAGEFHSKSNLWSAREDGAGAAKQAIYTNLI